MAASVGLVLCECESWGPIARSSRSDANLGSGCARPGRRGQVLQQRLRPRVGARGAGPGAGAPPFRERSAASSPTCSCSPCQRSRPSRATPRAPAARSRWRTTLSPCAPPAGSSSSPHGSQHAPARDDEHGSQRPSGTPRFLAVAAVPQLRLDDHVVHHRHRRRVAQTYSSFHAAAPGLHGRGANRQPLAARLDESDALRPTAVTVVDERLRGSKEFGLPLDGTLQGILVAGVANNGGHMVAVKASFAGDGADDSISFFGVRRNDQEESHVAVVGGTGRYTAPPALPLSELLVYQKRVGIIMSA